MLVVLGLLKHLAALVPPIAEYAYALAAAAQLYAPLTIADRLGISRAELGLEPPRWRRDLALAAALGLATVLPYAVGHHYWQTLVMHRPFSPRLPDGLLLSIATQLIAVALPEELFFRGYLQARMELLWPSARRLFGAPFGRALVLSNVVFALAHFVGEYRPDRLGPFFPGLLFGVLRARTGGLVAPVVYHALCNLLSEVLFASYR